MIEDQPLPHAEGSEKFVLSSFFNHPHLMDEHPLDPEIFFLPHHREIYKALVQAKPVEITHFAQSLWDAGKIEDVGGPAALSELLSYARGPYFSDHLGRIRARHSRRMAIAAARRAIEAAFDCSEGDDSQNYLDALSGPITAVFDVAAGCEPPVDVKQLAREFVEEFERRLRGESLAMGFQTGIPEIDANIKGIHRQHMGVISGRTGGGKSTLATQIAVNLATEEVGVLYLILERTEQSVFQRSVIQLSNVRAWCVNDPANNRPTVEEARAIRLAIQSIASSNLHFRKPSNRRLPSICAEIRRYVRKHGVQVVFLDQIGLVRGERQKGDTGEAELRGISNTLQELAHELNIALVVMSQMNADGDTKGAKAVEEDCDWNLSIIQEMDRSKETFRDHKHILLAKDSHNGNEGTRLPLLLDKETLRFRYGVIEEPETKRKGRFE
jgi:replicative DNA helicase